MFVNAINGKYETIDLKKDGLVAFILPIMIPMSNRIEEAPLNVLLELFFLLTLSNPTFDENKPIPKILIVFQMLPLLNADSDEDEDEP